MWLTLMSAWGEQDEAQVQPVTPRHKAGSSSRKAPAAATGPASQEPKVPKRFRNL